MTNSLITLGEAAARIWPGPRRTFLHLLLFSLLYVFLYRTSNIFHTTDLRATPWNPETGVAIVAGAVLGWRAIPAIFAAHYLGNLIWSAGYSASWNLISAIAHTITFCGSAALARPWLLRLTAPTPLLIAQFLVYSIIITAISVLVRIGIAVWALQISPEYLYRYTLAVSVGNFIGAITVAPAFLVFHHPRDGLAYLRSLAPLQWLFLALIAVATYLVFGLKGTDEFKFFYLLFIPVIAFATRDGIIGATLSTLLTDVAMILILYLRDFEPSTALELQILMSSLSATGLFLGAAVSESRRFSEELDISHKRLQDSQAALLQASRLSLAGEMAAALAHELNQPLTAIRNFARSTRRLLERPRIDRKKLLSHIDHVVNEVDGAAKLIRNTRAFLSRGEAVFAPVSLAETLDTSAALVETEFDKVGVSLSVNRPARLPHVQGNGVQLQQVILNLLRNAKDSLMTAPNGLRRKSVAIDVSTTNRPGLVEIAVSDNGPGVASQIAMELFSPLRSSKPDGLGLGLSLCKSIVAAHGGTIWHDAGFSGGARFIFTLPVRREKMRG